MTRPYVSRPYVSRKMEARASLGRVILYSGFGPGTFTLELTAGQAVRIGRQLTTAAVEAEKQEAKIRAERQARMDAARPK